MAPSPGIMQAGSQWKGLPGSAEIGNWRAQSGDPGNIATGVRSNACLLAASSHLCSPPLLYAIPFFRDFRSRTGVARSRRQRDLPHRFTSPCFQSGCRGFGPRLPLQPGFTWARSPSVRTTACPAFGEGRQLFLRSVASSDATKRTNHPLPERPVTGGHAHYTRSAATCKRAAHSWHTHSTGVNTLRPLRRGQPWMKVIYWCLVRTTWNTPSL